MIASISLPRAPSSASLRRFQRAMARDGAAYVSGLFSRPMLEKIRARVLRLHESGELKKRGLVRDIGGRYAAVLPFEGPFLSPAFYGDSKLAALVAALLGPDYCISSLETVISLPGSSPQHQHIDGPIRFDRQIGRRKTPYAGDLSDLPPYAVTLSVPLCDVDEENGPTAIWAGSHKAALRARPPSEAEVARRWREERMDCPFGGAFFFDYRVFHGGTPNYSREPRPLLILVFARRWFRDPNLADVHPRIVISKQALSRVPEKHRPLFMLAPAARRALWA